MASDVAIIISTHAHLRRSVQTDRSVLSRRSASSYLSSCDDRTSPSTSVTSIHPLRDGHCCWWWWTFQRSPHAGCLFPQTLCSPASTCLHLDPHICGGGRNQSFQAWMYCYARLENISHGARPTRSDLARSELLEYVKEFAAVIRTYTLYFVLFVVEVNWHQLFII